LVERSPLGLGAAKAVLRHLLDNIKGLGFNTSFQECQYRCGPTATLRDTGSQRRVQATFIFISYDWAPAEAQKSVPEGAS
jgi:hypothetical protein